MFRNQETQQKSYLRNLSLSLSVVGTAVVRPARRAADATRRVTAVLSVSTKTGSDIISSAARVFRLNPNQCPPWAPGSWPKPPRAARCSAPVWRKPPTPPEHQHRPHLRPPAHPTQADTKKHVWHTSHDHPLRWDSGTLASLHVTQLAYLVQIFCCCDLF